MFADEVIHFYQNLRVETALPEGIEVMHPHANRQTAALAEKFYRRFYSDEHSRTFIIGINPGRYGAGVTGVPFTDPAHLADFCTIENDLPRRPELSAEFIYRVINAYGGAEKFYSQYYFSSVFPLALVKNGLNFNYYDDPELLKSLMPYMAEWLREQISFGGNPDRCVCLGSGKNLSVLKKLNAAHRFFNEILFLDHPRYIMQYKRKQLEYYTMLYLKLLELK